ncbi:hypothetical protein [Halobacteriovorax sp.]|uniref:hypothetical protein n=1 Tax=Halobacteriovorax sp. TaxID=2020862 RepID=UPI0035625A74
MKKLLAVVTAALLLASCSSNNVAKNSPAIAEREVASVSAPGCMIEQHSRNKSWYRVNLNGVPHNEHWYGKKQVERIKNNYLQKGKCK